MTHWKALTDRTYLGHWDIEGHEPVVTIAKVESVKLENQGRKQRKAVIWFEGKEKAFVSNTTTIERLYGPHIEGWVGKKIKLYVTQTSTPNGMSNCIRIRPEIPKTKANGKKAARETEQDYQPTEEEIAALGMEHVSSSEEP